MPLHHTEITPRRGKCTYRLKLRTRIVLLHRSAAYRPKLANELPAQKELQVQEAKEDGWGGHADLRQQQAGC